MMRVGSSFIVLAAVIASSPAAAADREPICADRPGIGTGTCTVPAGVVQLETGFFDWARDHSDGAKLDELVIGETAVKLGISGRLHVEVGAAPYARVRVRDGQERQTVSGFGDSWAAAKYRLTGETAPVRLALYPFVKIPTARPSLGNGKVEGGLIVPIEFDLQGSAVSVTLSPELGLVADGDGSGRHVALGQVIGLGMPFSARLSGSAEIGVTWDFEPSGTVREYVAAASLAYLVSDDVQVDAGVNIGLNGPAADTQLYSGVALRF